MKYSVAAVHADVHKKIMESLSTVCNKLNFSSNRIQVGFICQCGKRFEPHIAILPPLTTPGPLLFATCSV